jgi:hypothetical protein
MKRTQLQREVRNACHLLLPSWFKYRKGGLYRRTEDFVQWLYFDIVEYRIALRPSFSVQDLASQIPAPVFTLGGEIRSPNGLSTWIEPDNWLHEREQILDYVVQQVRPSPEKPLTTGSILQFLHLLGDDHHSFAIAKGIALMVLGDFERGYAFFEDARSLLTRNPDPPPWVLVERGRIERWLSQGPDTIVSVLREDAREGMRILRIK